MDLRQIQQQAVNALTSTRLMQSVANGKIARDQYSAYLCDVYVYAQHSSQVIGLAASRLALSHPDLSQYLFSHAKEELGHDRWAASDLSDLGLSHEELAHVQPSSPCRRMIALEYYYAVHDNPIGLFGWMFVLESLGGRVGGNVAQALDQALSLRGQATYFLRGHGEADAHHSDDLYRVISEHIRQSEDVTAFSSMAAEAQDLYCDILDCAWLRSAQAA